MWCSEVRQKAKEAQVVAEQVLGNDRHAEDGTTVLVVNLTTQAADDDMRPALHSAEGTSRWRVQATGCDEGHLSEAQNQ